MSNDLISRSKLTDALNLWGCYKHENPKAYDTLMLYEILEAIEDQPTAYDVDAVLEELLGISNAFTSESWLKLLRIVKRGGVE